MRPLIAAAVLAGLTANDAFAWGAEGHRIVADIAEQFLQLSTAREVRALLAVDNETTLADVSNWADQIRDQRRETATWHFVDIPITAPGYDASRDCPHDDCVVAKIEEFAAELRDRTLPPRERLEALRFVVHFVGDLHQPLHASDSGDRGGNAIRVEFLGHKTNLHAVWDSGILAPAVNSNERGYALALIREIIPSEIAAWSKGAPVDWANESHAIAVKEIYGALPHASGLLPASYEDAALPIVDSQLERAGVRLAAVLDASLP